MKNKCNLTKEQNIFLAKKNLIDNIYACARLDGLNITLSEVRKILSGPECQNIKNNEIQIVLNLRDAWNYVINNVDKETDLEFICKVNECVARNESLEWGVLRSR